jgi:hypothetical protein
LGFSVIWSKQPKSDNSNQQSFSGGQMQDELEKRANLSATSFRRYHILAILSMIMRE